MFGIRFDLRNPPISSVTLTDRYQAALEMCLIDRALAEHAVDIRYFASGGRILVATSEWSPAVAVRRIAVNQVGKDRACGGTSSIDRSD
jgi:hypothetical protein